MEIHDESAIDVLDLSTDCLFVLEPKPRLLQKRVQSQTRVHDMSSMSELSDAAILHNLQVGFTRNMIYTNIGPTLVAVNPYRTLRCTMNENAPGILRTVREIYEEMLKNRESHSCVVTGESGAGKTESVRLFVNQLACLSIRRSKESKHQFLLQDRIVQAGPILESFGNAKTIRNRNSSRFGKWIEIEIDFMTGQPLSAMIRNYMLEKSRIVRLAKDERNFHIFYEVLSDMDACKEYGLEHNGFNSYRLLCGSPVEEFGGLEQVRKGMKTIGMTEDEMEFVFRTVAAVLIFGNITFVETKESCCQLSDQEENTERFYKAAEMLGLPGVKLLQSLLNRTISTGVVGDDIVKPRQLHEVLTGADAFIKAIYHALFEWMTERINISLDGIADDIENDTPHEGPYERLIESGIIGILDAFGFEIFEKNSFEQLCINYCNEKMQMHFNRLVFEDEIREYQEQGICTAAEIEAFRSNENSNLETCIKLLEGGRGHGIFALIDDEIKVPNGNDEGLLRKLMAKHKEHPNFSVPTRKRTTQNSAMLFSIHHYAGKVTYGIDGFLQKSSDPLPRDLQMLCACSNDTNLRSSFPSVAEIQEMNKGMRSKKTLGTQFKEQLSYLSTLIFEESVPHFIRCIKPNDNAQPGEWHGARVLQQIRYAGLLEASKVRAKGFPVRHLFDDFMGRYHFVGPAGLMEECPPRLEVVEESDKEGEAPGDDRLEDRRVVVQKLCKFLEVSKTLNAERYRIGKTKIFLKEDQQVQLERRYTAIVSNAARRFQSLFRRFQQFQRWSKVRKKLSELDEVRKKNSCEEIACAITSVEDALQCAGIMDASRLPAIEKAKKRKEELEKSSSLIGSVNLAISLANFEELVRATEACMEAGIQDPTVTEARNIIHAKEVLQDLIAGIRKFEKLAAPCNYAERKFLRVQLSCAKKALKNLREADQPSTQIIHDLKVEDCCERVERHSRELVKLTAAATITEFFVRSTWRAISRRSFLKLAAARASLELALDTRDEAGIDDGLKSLDEAGFGKRSAHPHYLVQEAVTVLADLRIAKLAALNQLERLTKKLQRRIRHREKQMRVELCNRQSENQDGRRFSIGGLKPAARSAEAAMSNQKISGPALLPVQDIKTPKKRKKNKEKKKKRRGFVKFNILRNMPLLFHNNGKKTQVRKSELELLTQAIQKAREAGATEDDEGIKQARLLVLKLEDLKQQRRSAIRLFSSNSLMSLASSQTRESSVADEYTTMTQRELKSPSKPSARMIRSNRDFEEQSLLENLRDLDRALGISVIEEQNHPAKIVEIDEEGDPEDDNKQNKEDHDASMNVRSSKSNLSSDVGSVDLGENAGQDFDIQILVEDEVSDAGSNKGTSSSIAAKVNDTLRRTLSVKNILPRKGSLKRVLSCSRIGSCSGKLSTSSKPGSSRLGATATSFIPKPFERKVDPEEDTLGSESDDDNDEVVLPENNCDNNIPGLTPSAQRAILDRICRERDMRRVIENRFWESRRAMTGIAAHASLLPSAASPQREYSFSSLYNSNLQRTSHKESFQSDRSNVTLPEAQKRMLSTNDTSQKRLSLGAMYEARVMALKTASAESFASSCSSCSSISRNSVKAFRDHWENLSFMSKNVRKAEYF